MEKRKCPNCKSEIDALDMQCPSCGELLFDEPISVESISEEEQEETIDEMLEEESFITKGIIKGWFAFVETVHMLGDKIPLALQYIRKNAGKSIKKFFSVYLVQGIKWIIKKTKVYKLKPYITYSNVLGISIAISSLLLVILSARYVIYLDTKSEITQISKETTYNNIKSLYKNDGNQSLDLSDGTLVYTYEDQTVGGIDDCIVYYKINPSTNKVVDLYIVYKSNVFNNDKMRNYLDVNYGMPKNRSLDVVWKYEDENILYTFTNGVKDDDREQVRICYKKNVSEDTIYAQYKKELEKSKLDKDKEEPEDKKEESEDKEESKDKKDKSEDKEESKDKKDKSEDKEESKDKKDKSEDKEESKDKKKKSEDKEESKDKK